MLFDVGVESVLDHVFWSASKELWNCRPFFPNRCISFVDCIVLFLCKFRSVYIWIKFVDISFPDLFARSRGDLLRNFSSIFPVLFNQVFNQLILFMCSMLSFSLIFVLQLRIQFFPILSAAWFCSYGVPVLILIVSFKTWIVSILFNGFFFVFSGDWIFLLIWLRCFLSFGNYADDYYNFFTYS